MEYIENKTDGEIAEAMVRGEIVGPVVTNNCFLINIRITGTGLTPRTYNGVTTTFNRPPGVFLSDKFLDMCNGLPCAYYNVEIGHPTDGELDYDNFKSYIVGSIMLPYVKGSEVWGIARIFNLDLLQAILDGKVLSTSPYVTSRSLEGRDGVIDENFDDINHVAFVQAGHWDQKEVGPAMIVGEVVYKKDPAQGELRDKPDADGDISPNVKKIKEWYVDPQDASLAAKKGQKVKAGIFALGSDDKTYLWNRSAQKYELDKPDATGVKFADMSVIDEVKAAVNSGKSLAEAIDDVAKARKLTDEQKIQVGAEVAGFKKKDEASAQRITDLGREQQVLEQKLAEARIKGGDITGVEKRLDEIKKELAGIDKGDAGVTITYVESIGDLKIFSVHGGVENFYMIRPGEGRAIWQGTGSLEDARQKAKELISSKAKADAGERWIVTFEGGNTPSTQSLYPLEYCVFATSEEEAIAEAKKQSIYKKVSSVKKSDKAKADAEEHKLIIKNLRDLKAECPCGWSMIAMTTDGESDDEIRKEAQDAFDLHMRSHKNDAEKNPLDKKDGKGVNSHADSKSGGEHNMNELETVKADAASKAEEIVKLKDELAKKDEAIKAADEAKAKIDAEEKEKAEKAKADADKAKDEELAKAKEDCAKKDAEIAELKKGKDGDDDKKKSDLKAKVDSMVEKLGDAAGDDVKGIQSLVNALVIHELSEGEEGSELIGKDDQEKDELVNKVADCAAHAHADIAVNRPVPKAESKFDYVRKLITFNKNLIDAKYHGLAAKVDASNFELAKDAVNSLIGNVAAETDKLNNKKGSGAVITTAKDGARVEKGWRPGR